jgi:BirA family transcriptional regulator, biotin operon repressor / biotin---[acetyl-CoA-carboxylase] ligase
MEIVTFNTLPNTNDFLMELSKKDANSWTVIHALSQSKGRGYAGNEWKVESDLNLTFSLLIKSDLNYKDLIALNEWVSYCIYLQLKKYSVDVEIKWPNDIIVNNKKVCGVLIENHRTNGVMNSVIGIGLNVNQTDFNHFPKASSLAIETAKSYDIVSILTELLAVFQENYYLIEEKQFQIIHNLYNENLFRRNIISTFKLDDKLVEGKILLSTNQGTLLVEIGGKEQEFLHKQIELIF